MKLSLALLPLLYCSLLHAQENPAGNEALPKASDTAVSVYYKFTDQRSRLYNGKEFIPFNPALVGQPYYHDDLLHEGSVWYDGLHYDGVSMQYDLVRDNLVIRHFDRFFKIALINEKVKEFRYNNFLFRRIVRDTANNITLSTGFYRVLHEGKISLLGRHSKRIEEVVSDKVIYRIEEKNTYYILKEGKYQQVKSQKSLMEILGGNQREIKQDLRKHGLKYRRDREAAIVRAVQFYDSSNN